MKTTPSARGRRQFLQFLSLLIAVTAIAAPRYSVAAEATAPKSVDEAVQRGVEFLSKAQAEDGSYSGNPGITAIAAAAMLRSGAKPEDAAVAKSLKHLEGLVHDDGGIYAEGSRTKNYETSIAMIAFNEANVDGRYDKLLAKAAEFVKKEQWDEGENQTPESMAYGGAGYGSHSRPDLSNTSFLIDALHAVGTSPDDPAIQRALIFVSRCQNLESKYNTTEFASKIDDGGFYYTIAAGGQSQAGNTPDGGLRSYGSMTYAGLKSMIYAGVSKDDPRVEAAYKWIRDHYTLEENPGMADQGLFYYYHTFAKSLNAMGNDQLVDKDGKSHDWRAELARHLVGIQQKDGSWVNKNQRWMETDPNLVTAYTLIALSYTAAKKTADAKPPVDHILSPPDEASTPRR